MRTRRACPPDTPRRAALLRRAVRMGTWFRWARVAAALRPLEAAVSRPHRPWTPALNSRGVFCRGRACVHGPARITAAARRCRKARAGGETTLAGVDYSVVLTAGGRCVVLCVQGRVAKMARHRLGMARATGTVFAPATAQGGGAGRGPADRAVRALVNAGLFPEGHVQATGGAVVAAVQKAGSFVCAADR